MSFAKEDKAAWLSSEIMQEFEKIARENDVLSGPPQEAFQPIGNENKSWEEEEDVINKEPIEKLELDADDIKTELRMAYNKNLFSSLEKLARQFAEKSNIKAAYRIEQTLHKLKEIFKEEK